MVVTKRGVYHNLKDSTYAVSNTEIALFFSSDFYRKKFLEGYEDNRNNFKYMRLEEESPLNLSTLADIHFYRKIEKRGFHVELFKKKITWEELHLYALRKMVSTEQPKWKKCNWW